MTKTPKLQKFYDFFSKDGTERLNGLDESYFDGMEHQEKEEAWNYLSNGTSLSEEAIKALFIIDKHRAVQYFKKLLVSPLTVSEFPDQQRGLEIDRLLLLAYVHSVDPDEQYIDAMSEFGVSRFASVRAAFAELLPEKNLTKKSVDALKQIIFTEVDEAALACAVSKFMLIHGLDFDASDPVRKSIYLGLSSENIKDKLVAIERLKKFEPNFVVD